jgi:hypothetical protein
LLYSSPDALAITQTRDDLGKQFMSTLQKLIRASAFGAAVLVTAPAMADSIDLTARAWAPADGNNSFSLGITTLQAFYTANGSPTLTFNAGAAAGCVSAGGGLACAGDGIGISSRLLGQDSGEIDTGIFNNETLRVSFGSAQRLLGFDVLNLFALETGQYRIDGGAWTNFGGAGGPGGLASVALGGITATTLEFRGANAISDFSVARLRVPEPGALSLVALSMLGVGLMRRRRARA